MNPGAYIFEASDFPEPARIVDEIRSKNSSAEIFVIGGDRIPGVVRISEKSEAVDALARRIFNHLPIAVVSPSPRQDLMEIANEGNAVGACFDRTIKTNLHEWSSHVIDLLPLLARSHTLASLEGSCSGLSGVIIGPGPSLAEIPKEKLVEICSGTVSIALNSAVGYLYDIGARPKIALGIEASEHAFPRMEMLSDPSVICAYGPHCHPSWPSSSVGDLLYVSQRAWPGSASICDTLKLPAIESGGSVSTVAYQILRHLGCEEIDLIGVDCRLGDDLEYDCTGRQTTVPDEQITETETNGGTKVRSLGILDMYRRWFERQASVNTSIRHFSSSENSAKINGFSVAMPKISGDGRIVEKIKSSEIVGKQMVSKWISDQRSSLKTRRRFFSELIVGIENSVSSMQLIRKHAEAIGPTMADDCYPMSVEEKMIATSFSSVNQMRDLVLKTIEGSDFLLKRLDSVRL